MNRIALAAALAASFAAVPAAAETATIGYADLNTATDAGAQVLAKRIENGVDAACQRPDLRAVKAMAEFESCKIAALANASDQLKRADAHVSVQVALN